MNSLDWLREAVKTLKNAGIRFPEKEAQEMLTAVGIDMVSLFRDAPEISKEALNRLEEFIQRRLNHEPLQYILGFTHFMNLRIKIERGVLIPRPETEILARETIRVAKKLPTERPRILDLCTGSGCIGLAIASEVRDAEIYATDISDRAIRLARENAELNGIKNIHFIKGDLFEPLKGLNIRFDIIVSNPPYIKTGEIPSLEPEVRDWEPLEAIDGGEDGLRYYKRIFQESKDFIKEKGYLLLELGASLYKEVLNSAYLHGFSPDGVIKDLSGIERVLKLVQGSKDLSVKAQ